MNGILPLWKPKGLTSHDCVVKIRKRYQTKKVGHTGTLDPEVEGVLPICIGGATKIVPFLTDTKKTYIAELQLGSATETEDRHGDVVETSTVSDFPSEDEIKEILLAFNGEITQIPPLYSAVKVKGKKLYEYARANEPVDRPKRKVQIFEIKLLSIDAAQHKIRFKVVCSKGTYIRTLCVDIGRSLGYPAHMSNLKRTATGIFTEENTIPFEVLNATDDLNKLETFLKPIKQGLTHLPSLQVDLNTKFKVQHGQKLSKPKTLKSLEPFVFMYGEEVLAIYKVHDKNPDQIKAMRVFHNG